MKHAIALLILFAQVAFGQIIGDPTIPVKSSSGHDSRVINWSTRVVANGGATPSTATLNALDAFVTGLDTDSLWSKMICINFIAPDSITAAQTPLLVGGGSDPWSNSGIPSGNLSVSGLAGDAAHVLNTGLNPSSAYASANSAGVSFYVYTGYFLLGVDVSTVPDLIASTSTFDCWDNNTANGRQYDKYPHAGFHSYNRTASAQADTYYGNNVVSTLVHTSTSTSASSTSNSGLTIPIHIFGDNHGNLTDLFLTSGTLSFVAFHTGLTSTDAQNLYNRVTTLRNALGGGTCDPIEEWSRRVVANGGSALSSGTKSSTLTFYNGIYSDGLLGKVTVVNPIAPDSLIASATPLIGFSSDPWVNHSLVSGDLSINGLTGNGSNKYYDTGITPSTLGGLVGAAVYMYNSGANGADFGSWSDAPANDRLTLTPHYSDGNSYGNDGGGSGVTVATSGNGFYAVNRTSSTDARLYFANSTHTFAQIGSTVTGSYTGAQSSQNCFFLAQSAQGSVSIPTSDTLSFCAVFYGASSTDIGNLYTRAQALRVAYGGGSR